MVSSKNSSTLPCAAIQKLNVQSPQRKSRSRANGTQAKLARAHVHNKPPFKRRILRRMAMARGVLTSGRVRVSEGMPKIIDRKMNRDYP